MNLLKKVIERFIRIIIVPKDRTTYVFSGDFFKEDTQSVRDKDECVIVGALKNPRQLSICIKNSFYHMPYYVAGDKAKKADYVAIYQSKNLFGRMSGIEYVGKIKKVSIVPRYKIKEIPKHTNDLYYRFDIQEWIRLERRILPDGTGVVCEYTTLNKLKNSTTINELFKK